MQAATLRRLPMALAVCTIIAGIAVWVVSAGPAGASATFSPQLSDVPAAEKVSVADSAPFTVAAAPKLATEIAAPSSPKRLSTAPGRTVVRAATSVSSSGSTSSKLTRARQLLNSAIARYPILKGSTVEFGDARGYQAICYYRSGRIVISPKHTASLDRIIAHEIWHIIDWRDNGRIDWGENIPPK